MKHTILFPLLLLLLGLPRAAVAQNSQIAYRGSLSDSGQPANGTYDLQFRLADASVNGNYIGVALTNSQMSVSNGLFTVMLDFGSAAFDGSPCWLEIGVRTNGSTGPYTVLAPRQAVTSLPYAIFAQNAAVARLARNLVLGGGFYGNGAGITNLNGTSIQGGTISSNQIDSATWALLNNGLGSSGNPALTNSGSNLTNLPVSSDWLAAIQPTPFLAYNTFADNPSAVGYGNFPVTETNLLMVGSWMSTNGYRAAGWQYVWIDDGWQADSWAADGSLNCNSNRFPNGLAWLVSQIHSKGLKVGIYTSMSELSCDSLPGTPERYVYQHVQQFANWGFDAIKVDMCGVSGGVDYSRTKSRLFNNAILASGRQMAIFNVSQPPPAFFSFESNWAGGDAWGVGMYDEVDDYPWASYTNAAAQLAKFSSVMGKGRYLDLGLVFYQNHLQGVKDAFELCAILPAQLQVGSPPNMMAAMRGSPGYPPSTWWQGISVYATNLEWGAIHQDPAVLTGSLAYSNNYLEVWTRPLGAYGSGKFAVLLANLATNGTQSITVPWSLLGVTPDTYMTVRSVWYQTNIGTFSAGWTYPMPQTQTELFLVRPYQAVPPQ